MSDDRLQPPPKSLVLVGVGILFAVIYPMAAERALAVSGARAVGTVLCVAGLISMALLHRIRELPVTPLPLRAAALALPVGAAVTGDPLYLRLIPAAIQGGVVVVFLLSLRGGGSLFLDVARIIEPHAPGFIGPYCRKTTAVFAAIFAFQGVAVGLLAPRAAANDWGFASGVLVWTPVLGGFAVEWLVRKTWFRNYGNSPLDRCLNRLFPAENTPAGRRSLEFIRRRRRELGMPQP